MKIPLHRFLHRRVLVVGLVAIFTFILIPVVQLRYPRALENEALISPIRVTAVTDTTIQLDDGRIFRLDRTDGSLRKILEESDFRVDVEPFHNNQYVEIFAKRRDWICGTPWTGLIRIPLFPDDIPINSRISLGYATSFYLTEQEGK